MPGQAAQPVVGRLAVRRDQPLEAVGDPGCGDDGARAGRVDVQPQPLPRRDRAQGRGVGLDPQVEVVARARGALAVPVDQRAEAAEGLLAGHLLLDDRGDEGLDEQVGAPEPPDVPTVASVDQHRVLRLEPARVVVGAEQVGHRVERPLGARGPRPRRAPRRRPGSACTTSVTGPRACGCRASARPGPVGLVRRVAEAAAVHGEDGADRARPRGSPRPGQPDTPPDVGPGHPRP